MSLSGRAAPGFRITEAAASRLGVPADKARELIESCEHYPPFAARVYSLG
ncbi:MAG TPA: hypothetical protein VF302_07020 [Candidatus Limnocylindrales bacterium]|jgi:hypothetical protein